MSSNTPKGPRLPNKGHYGLFWFFRAFSLLFAYLDQRPHDIGTWTFRNDLIVDSWRVSIVYRYYIGAQEEPPIILGTGPFWNDSKIPKTSPEGPSTQYVTSMAPKTIRLMVVGARDTWTLWERDCCEGMPEKAGPSKYPKEWNLYLLYFPFWSIGQSF